MFCLEDHRWNCRPVSVTTDCLLTMLCTFPPFCQVTFVVLAELKQMSTPFKNLEQQYATEVVKVDADEVLLKCLELRICGLEEVAESTG